MRNKDFMTKGACPHNINLNYVKIHVKSMMNKDNYTQK